MNGAIATVGQLFCLVQRDTGASVINLIGPISIHKGDDVTLRLTVTDDEDAREDITGATIELQVKAARGGADPALITRAVASGITILDQSDEDTIGQADADLSSAVTNIAAGLYYLSVVIVLAGKRQTLVDREFTILPVVNAP